jgi:ABC-type lipoprotein release transport system permease subunit
MHKFRRAKMAITVALTTLGVVALIVAGGAPNGGRR